MIQLFRKIRQKLLLEGNTGKYLKYAIGEIILVVIGILIALQINNWNEERKASRAENQALVALKTEFDQNIERLKYICEQRAITEAQLREYYEMITNDTIPVEIKAQTRRPAGFGGRWSVQNTVLNGLVNSGGIENIQNDSLKALLTWWPNRVNRWNDEESRWRDLRSKISDYLVSRRRVNIPTDSTGSWDYMPNNTRSGFQAQMEAIVNELEYQNYVGRDISLLFIQSRQCASIMEDYNNIMKALELEINYKKLK